MFLHLNKEPGKIEIVQLTKDSYLIGRDEDCDIVLSNNFISRKHCTLTWESLSHKGKPAYHLVDGVPLAQAKSRNGVFVNKERIGLIVRLQHLDVITFQKNTDYPRIIFLAQEDEKITSETL